MKLSNQGSQPTRKGTVAVLFAILLPVLIVVAAIAINVAQMQLTRTELKIATDAAARAGGRGWSEFQDLDRAKEFAEQAAFLNTIGGEPLVLGTNEADGQIEFGTSVQADDDSRFNFETLTEAEVEDGGIVSGIRINATHATPLFLEVSGVDTFTPRASSVASQVDRDIALVIDRSGSMAYFEGQVTNPGQGEQFLFDTLTALFNNSSNNIDEDDYTLSVADFQGVRRLARMSLNDREYSQDIINLLTGDLKQYAITVNSVYRDGTGGPDFSRWFALETAYDAFFEVLDATPQEEQVSVASFASEGRLEAPLSRNLDAARVAIADIRPEGSTAIGDGMWEAYVSLRDGPSRQSAVQTLIVMSDGVSRRGATPRETAARIIADNPRVVIHTVSFGAEADREEMAAVADLTTGSHFHAADGIQLIEIFRELAGSQRTLITQ